MGKSTISMAMFNSYVKLPEGKSHFTKINQVTSKKFPIDSGLLFFFSIHVWKIDGYWPAIFHGVLIIKNDDFP